MSRRQYLPYLLLALGSAAYLFPFVRAYWHVADEGAQVYGAQRVAEGAVPCRDFFEVMGPGAFFWLAGFFKIFGSTWLVARAVLLATGVATTLIVYWLARAIHSPFATLTAVLTLITAIPMWAATSHHWDSNLFALGAFACFVFWRESSNRWLLMASGLLAGATTFFLQQKGVLLLLGLLLALCVLRRRNPDGLRSTAWLLAGYGSAVSAGLAGLYAAGALPDFLYANLIWPMRNYQHLNSVPYAYGFGDFCASMVGWSHQLHPWPPAYLAAGLCLAPLTLIVALPVLLAGLAALRPAAAFNSTTLPFWAGGVALWLSEIHRSDIPHLIFGSPLLVVLCLHLLGQQQRKSFRYGMGVLACSVVLFGALHALGAGSARTRVMTRRGAVYTFGDDAALEFLDHETRPGDKVFVYPYFPMYYFLSATANPTRYSQLVYHFNTEAQFRETVSSLERSRVKYVLWDTSFDGPNLTHWFPAYQHPPQEKLILEPYLLAHYDLLGYKSGFRVMQRKETLTAAASGDSLPGANDPLTLASVR